MTKFQAALLSVFAFFIFVGIAAFSLYQGSGSKDSVSVVLWGTLPEKQIRVFLGTEEARAGGFKVDYREKSPETIENDLLEAIAAGVAPDMMLLSQDFLLPMKNKILPLPKEYLRERDFKDQFASGAEIFLSPEGAFGIPLAIDPLVLYWNRGIFQDNGFSEPPLLWQDFYILAPKLTERDSNKSITRSAVALGEYGNVSNAKELLAALFLQAGTPIVSRGENGPVSALESNVPQSVLIPAESALRFYSEFSDPGKDFYSWNKSLPSSREAFLQGNLATYFGFASELPALRGRNPNLDFYVAPLPQVVGAEPRQTYGRFYAFLFPRNGRNVQAAISVANFLSSSAPAMSFANTLLIPPARRDILGKEPTDAYLSVFFESALLSKTWTDPSPRETEKIFSDMISNITSGKTKISGAVNEASSDLNGLLSRYRSAGNATFGR